jgi:hypothetical protein
MEIKWYKEELRGLSPRANYADRLNDMSFKKYM